MHYFLSLFFLNLPQLWSHVINIKIHRFKIQLIHFLTRRAERRFRFKKLYFRSFEFFGISVFKLISLENVENLAPVWIDGKTFILHHLLSCALGGQQVEAKLTKWKMATKLMGCVFWSLLLSEAHLGTLMRFVNFINFCLHMRRNTCLDGPPIDLRWGYRPTFHKDLAWGFTHPALGSFFWSKLFRKLVI